MIRDVLLQHGTPVALTDYAYLLTAVVGSVVVFLIKISEESWNRLFTGLDAAVIGFWAVAGANKTLAVGLGWLPAVLLGTLTAVGGGALRDVILGRVPAVFGRNGLYATVAVAVAGVTVACSYLGVPQVGIGLGVALALVFRLTAVHYGWNLPKGRAAQPPACAGSAAYGSSSLEPRITRRVGTVMVRARERSPSRRARAVLAATSPMVAGSWATTVSPGSSTSASGRSSNVIRAMSLRPARVSWATTPRATMLFAANRAVGGFGRASSAVVSVAAVSWPWAPVTRVWS